MCVDELFAEVFVTIPLWYILLLLGAIVAAVLLRSITLSIGVIILAVVGLVQLYDVTGINDLVRYGMVAVYLTLAGFMVCQLLFQVNRI